MAYIAHIDMSMCKRPGYTHPKRFWAAVTSIEEAWSSHADAKHPFLDPAESNHDGIVMELPSLQHSKPHGQ